MENCPTEIRTLEGWEKDEKFQLLQALNEYGCSDIEQIQSFISFKTKEEIETAINFYNRKASNNPVVIRKREKRMANASIIPIGCWAKLLTDTKTFEELKTEIAVALRLIAEFEDTPPVVCTDQIDFKKAYHFLANAVEGKSIPDNTHIKTIFEKCLVDIAITSKLFMKPQTLKKVIDDINVYDQGMKTKPQVSKMNEVTNIRYLSSQRQYNPLNIEEEYLKASN